MKIIKRPQDIDNVKRIINNFPVTALLGPRQSGKTFLAKQFKYDHYFDLENPRDLAQFENPQLTLEDLKGLIVIDEVQRLPELFKLIRYLVDNKPEQKYLILGSASGVLMRQSSESLAGRIGYYYLGGFGLSEIKETEVNSLWLRGGFPRAFTASSDAASFLWIENYIRTFLERDIPQLGITITSNTLRKFWIMLSHYHGQILNYSELGRSFGIADMTVRKYIDILEHTFMVRTLQPWFTNIGKRLVKRPKLYIRDSGIFHSLMSISSKKQLNTHNKLGASWEGFALECVAKILKKRDEELYFWNIHSGAELDLFWQDMGKNWGAEFKYSDAPKLTKSMQIAIQDLNLSKLWIIYPGKTKYKLSNNIIVTPLTALKSGFEN
ncbi:MAG: ATP-binding protein [bacterium]